MALNKHLCQNLHRIHGKLLASRKCRHPPSEWQLNVVIRQADSPKHKVGYLYQFGKTEIIMKCVTKATLYEMVLASFGVIRIVQVIAKTKSLVLRTTS